jgi:hypothetical protein
MGDEVAEYDDEEDEQEADGEGIEEIEMVLEEDAEEEEVGDGDVSYHTSMEEPYDTTVAQKDHSDVL